MRNFDKTSASNLYLFLMLIYIYHFYETRNSFYLKYLAVGVALIKGSSMLKEYLAEKFPNVTHFKRPATAVNCGLYNNQNISEAGRPGFPSVHLFITSYLLTGLFLLHPTKHLVFHTFMYATMVWARSDCHTPTQMAAGTVLGVGFGLTFYKLFSNKI